MRIAVGLMVVVSSVATAGSTKLDKVATDVLAAQLPQVPHLSDDDDAHRRARYTSDAVLLGATYETVADTAEDDVNLIPSARSGRRRRTSC